MDYFYGAPRLPPTPPTINQIQRIPVVPEVSMVENSFFAPRSSKLGGYNPTVRLQNPSENIHAPRDSLSYGSSFLSKKHVRFKNSFPEPTVAKENVPQSFRAMPDLNGKTFKQIYMANVPDRHLDLSIFESPRAEIKSPETNREFLRPNSQFKPVESPQVSHKRFVPSSEITSLKSIENIPPSPRYSAQKSNQFAYNTADYKYQERWTQKNNGSSNINSLQNSQTCMEICPQKNSTTGNVDTNFPKCTEVATPNNEPTIKDLFRIIQQQNEQIMLLQRQINNLKTSIRKPEIDSAPVDNPLMKELTSSPTKKGVFSFDVKATSFEFSFRPQHKFRKQNDFLEPKIQEIVECDNSTEANQNSLRLDESLNVKDSYMSDVPSIEIKMDDYHSSEEDEEPQYNIGLTFYKDLMDQVNNVLQKVRKQSEYQMAANKKPDMAGQTMNAVKQATLQHLKNIGVNLSPIQESSEVTRGSELDIDNCDESEISCAVQQLLMKYLPQDKLAKAVNKPKQQPTKLTEKRLKPPSPEFSFATLQYMKKYNIIDNSRKLQEHERPRVPAGNPKILDVTALKLQPKLL